MRKFFMASFVVVAVAICPSLHAASDQVQISVQKKSEKADTKVMGAEGKMPAKEGSEVSYDIKLADAVSNDLADLTVEYIIFVERQKLGEKKDHDVVARETGSQVVPLLTKKEPQTITTKVVKLAKTNLVGNYYFPNGGRIKVEDNVKGVWIRVTKGGTLIGEYANPSTIKTRGWEKK